MKLQGFARKNVKIHMDLQILNCAYDEHFYLFLVQIVKQNAGKL